MAFEFLHYIYLLNDFEYIPQSVSTTVFPHVNNTHLIELL